jgi:hypothetical protein
MDNVRFVPIADILYSGAKAVGVAEKGGYFDSGDHVTI